MLRSGEKEDSPRRGLKTSREEQSREMKEAPGCAAAENREARMWISGGWVKVRAA